jgi:hypothetical protein
MMGSADFLKVVFREFRSLRRRAIRTAVVPASVR